MKPLLGVELADPGEEELRELEAFLNGGLLHAPWLERGAELTLITSEDELRQFEAGELVLYRKRPRSQPGKYVYKRGDEKVELVQEKLFAE